MSAYLWRLTDHHAVLYTDDRSILAAALAYPRFPHHDLNRATTYHGKNNRVFAWQFTFPLEIWNGLVRHLGRAALTFLDEEKPRKTREAAPPPQPAAATPASTTTRARRPIRSGRSTRGRRRSPSRAAHASTPGRSAP